LIRSRKQLAQQHYEQVRVTVQAMLLRGIDPVGITVSTVSKEAGVSVATIYRREELFALVQHANPQVQRWVSEQVYQGSLRQLQEELERAKAEVVASQNEAQLAKLGARRPQQEVIQLKKTLVALQRQVVCLEALLARCTCRMQSNPPD
jgi:hypothetical protein